MPYHKQTILLKGPQLGLLTLEYRDVLQYTLQPGSYTKDAQLILFFSPSQYLALPVPKGQCTLPATPVYAAAILQEDALLYTGQTAPFNWAAAQQTVLARLSPAPAPLVQTTTNTLPAPPEVPEVHPQQCPCLTQAATSIDPFPQLWSQAVWQKIHYPYFPSSCHYLAGKLFHNGRLIADAFAIPGEYALNPPAWLSGFNHFARSTMDQQGYWLLFKDAETGQPLSYQQLIQ